jgi:lipopolysaccharide transport system ATP-binding protein
MKTVISVENVSKMYRLGEVGTGTISHDLNRWWHKIRGKDDPYLKIGESNDRSSKGSSEYVYALKDINFEVKEGEVLGIIGKNGAGKSTLLKLLSMVTSPTSGRIRIKGRTASLLEVGTGFHPELTGRENIFLNGAILGMTKAEIRNKFDEIVDFSGVERYIDTPVKRYSSGMYVRLAFAVAAHLDPEILIIDEVLAVGDAEFQKKCLGKMGDISKNEGRTILFVSHNMGAVKSLCPKSILIKNGLISFLGNTQDVLNEYKKGSINKFSKPIVTRDSDDLPFEINSVIFYKNGEEFNGGIMDVYDKLTCKVDFEVRQLISNTNIQIEVEKNGDFYFGLFEASENEDILINRRPGLYSMNITLPCPIFKPGFYNIGVHVGKFGYGYLQRIDNALSFEVEFISRNPRFDFNASHRPGDFATKGEWEVIMTEV